MFELTASSLYAIPSDDIDGIEDSVNVPQVLPGSEEGD